MIYVRKDDRQTSDGMNDGDGDKVGSTVRD